MFSDNSVTHDITNAQLKNIGDELKNIGSGIEKLPEAIQNTTRHSESFHHIQNQTIERKRSNWIRKNYPKEYELKRKADQYKKAEENWRMFSGVPYHSESCETEETS